MMSRGVTLVELIVVISIIGILVVALGFSYVGWQGKYKVEQATKEIHSALMTARSIAITRRINYLAAFPTATSYTVMADANDNGVADDTPLPTFPKPIEYTISWTGVSPILFDTKGLIRWDRNNDGIEETTDVIRLTTTPDPDSDYDCVVISQTRIAMGKWNTGVCGVK